MDDRPVVSPEPQIIKPPPEPIKPASRCFHCRTHRATSTDDTAPTCHTAATTGARSYATHALTPVPSPRCSPAVIALVERGDSPLMDLGDITAAQLLFQRAAESGQRQSAMKLANTYDPGFISSHHPDRHESRSGDHCDLVSTRLSHSAVKAEERLASIVEYDALAAFHRRLQRAI